MVPKQSVLLFEHCACHCHLLIRFSEDAELDDAVHTALLTMREGFEGEMTEKNIEVNRAILFGYLPSLAVFLG